MRYYHVIFNTSSEEIKEKAKVKFSSYYDNTFGKVNDYLYRNLKNGLNFYIYREENNLVYAILAYSEKDYIFERAYDEIIGRVRNDFQIKKMKSEPSEITMLQFHECLLEGQRREYLNLYGKMADELHLSVYRYFDKTTQNLCYDLQEQIVTRKERKANALYDQKFIHELENIESHQNVSTYSGNMVHYIISSRSMEAADDMTEMLMQRLLKANRISSRRKTVISQMYPDVYKQNNYIEELIENNVGGVIVFDLSEKFGYDSTDYLSASQYLEMLVKKYRNQCLFVFTYNMDKPGFAYYLLPNLKKYVIPVMLREGTGDRKAAVRYMRELIKGSQYAQYAKQANEFMELFPGDTFTQTDVLMAYEQFEAWCLNKNVLKAYDYDLSEDFMLDRDENAVSAYDKLQQMIGLNAVKNQIDQIIDTDLVEKERKKRMGRNYEAGTMHMIFGGNPGSAKTTVARLFAGIAKEKGILKSGVFVELGGMDLDGFCCDYVIREAFTAAKGGVLFIDEAYSMKSSLAITVLLQELENHREDVIVVLAGYNEKMHRFMELNEGLKSRIPYWIDFPDYNAGELTEIFKMMLKERGFHAEEAAVKEAYDIFDKVRRSDNFGNGRYVRNLMERAVRQQSERLMSVRKNPGNIREDELFLISKADIGRLETGQKEKRTVGTARKELDEMIGLDAVKKVIHKAIANYKLHKLYTEKGISKENASLHMVFTGNPGTAKTTVARLFAEILKDEKVLPTGSFVEAGRADLVGSCVGSTAPLVKQKFKEAQGGVLFIDEAYALCDGYSNGYGDEAIHTIVQEMENHREDVIVIFAGYPEPMQQFLDRNPGMRSRIAFQVAFEDYSIDELCVMTKLMLSRKHMTATEAAMEKLRRNYEGVHGSRDYGNGRFVRKMLEEAEMNLSERLTELMASDDGTEDLTVEQMTTLEACDIPEAVKKEANQKRRIGFAAAD